jgi:antitoxin component YwqK of YwqJK toxin-antitoxin module
MISGVVKKYYPSGSIREEITCKSHRLHGPYKSYYEDGQVEWEGENAANKKVGEWILYDQKGKIQKKQIFENNQLTKELNILN